MNDLPSLLAGVALLAVGAALLLLARRSVARVDSADAADQADGGLHLAKPFERWFGIGLLGVPIVILLAIGALLIVGSLSVLSGPGPNL